MLTALSRLPFVGPFFGFIIDKGRLVIEYLLIAAVVALCAVTTTMWIQKNAISAKLDKTKEQVTDLKVKVDLQDATISDLKALRTTDAEALTGLLTDFKSLSKNDATVRDRLRKLEQSNEAVRQYLETPIPVELQCLLAGTCAASGKGGASSPASSPTR